MKPVFIIVALVLTMVSNGHSETSRENTGDQSERRIPQRIVVPAFFELGSDWEAIEAAGTAVRAVVPELSFSQIDPKTNPELLKKAKAQFRALRKKGQKVLGYVSTQNGRRDRALIDKDISNWYALYHKELDGIFFDEGPQCDDNMKGFYSKLIRNLKQKHPKRNFVMLNAPQFPNEWVIQVADLVILWEETATAYNTKYGALGARCALIPPPKWWSKSRYFTRVAHIIHTAPADQMPDLVKLARRRGAGNVYVFDGTSGAYKGLPAYWLDLVKEVQKP